MAAPSIVQSKTVGGECGNDPFTSHRQKTTLDSATTNGNTLVAFFFRGSAVGDAGDPLYTDTDVADWTFPVDVEFLNGEARSYVMVGYRTVEAGENSCEFDWDNGSGTPENCCSALFEIDADVTVAANAVSDISGTGNTVVLDAVSALLDDLLIAAAQFHDNDGTTPSWTNSFSQETEAIATGGEPDDSLRTASRDADSDASFGTTLSWSTPPGADQRDGVIVAIRHTLAVDAGTDQALTLPGVATLDATITGSADSQQWTKAGGPGVVEFGDSEDVDTTAAFSAPGVYRLKLTATKGSIVASDELIVTVTAAVQAEAATVNPPGYPQVVETIMTILDGWTPITPEDLNVYQDTMEKLERLLGAGSSDAAQTQFGPRGANTDLAQRLDRFLEQDGGLNEVAYVTGLAELGEFAEDGGGKLISFGKNIDGASLAPNSYHVMFTCLSPGVTGSLYERDAPALWWTDVKFPGSVIIKARKADGGEILVGDDTQVVYALLAVGYGAYGTGVL